MNRRRFLKKVGAWGASTSVLGTMPGVLGQPLAWGATAGVNSAEAMASSVRFSREQVTVPDAGWRMWPDRKAEWKNDSIHLPGEFELQQLPQNAPTGGWASLNKGQGSAVELPATVEQFYWGIDGLRPYHEEYKFEQTDHDVLNGAYYGVSWWWRSLEIPQGWAGKRVLLHVRGARQRAEVYLNRRLVGYSILAELPFECDLSQAMQPGQVNELAIRITNPGGRLDWVDSGRIQWGGLEIHKGHGFGGVDRGLVLSAHDELRFSDLWVLNTPEPKNVTAHAQVENHSQHVLSGKVRFTAIDPATGKAVASAEKLATIPAGAVEKIETHLSAPGAHLWDLQTPVLYTLRAEWIGGANQQHALREVDFGFRWIGVEGIGSNATIRLNGRRIRLYTSISWGYWGLNGLFPTPELARKEVAAAQQMNLNTLNAHRNLVKEDVLYLQDRAGLLRCLEPGGGSQAVIPAEGIHASAQRYMRAKIRGMIRAFRSHPSVVHYIVQNEASLKPDSAEVASLFAEMQAEDPSRTIVGNDGFTMRSLQVWSAPYSTELHKSSQKATVEGGAAGWWVDHTGHFSDVWQDSYYNSPSDYYYYSPITAEVVEWGEMKGTAAPDNHVRLIGEIEKHGGHSYDLAEHKEMLAAMDAFLDRHGFRKAFPRAEDLLLSLGKRAYDSWAQFLENIRLCEQNDMAAISGWESTAMENHSGLVDNFRNFKADPTVMAKSLLPVRPIAKQHALVLKTGERAHFDLYLANDTGHAVQGKLTFTLQSPDGSHHEVAVLDAPEQTAEKFSYLLREKVETPVLDKPGIWQTHLALAADSRSAHTCELLVVDPTPAAMPKLTVALAGVAPEIEQALGAIPGLTLVPFRAGVACDAIVALGAAAQARKPGVEDADGAYKNAEQMAQQTGLSAELLAAVRQGKPLLAVPFVDEQAEAAAKQLAPEFGFVFQGMVGPSRASWMGSWYFARQHPLFDGMPTNQALGLHYQIKGNGSNGWMVEGEHVEIAAAYNRDHDRRFGAGAFAVRTGQRRLVMHRIAGMNPVLQQRFVANALRWLTA